MAPCRVRCRFAHFHTIPHFLRSKLHRYNKFLFNVNRGFDVGQIAAALRPICSVTSCSTCTRSWSARCSFLTCATRTQSRDSCACSSRRSCSAVIVHSVSTSRVMRCISYSMAYADGRRDANLVLQPPLLGRVLWRVIDAHKETTHRHGARRLRLRSLLHDRRRLPPRHVATPSGPPAHPAKAFERLQRVSVSNKCMARRALQIGRELSEAIKYLQIARARARMQVILPQDQGALPSSWTNPGPAFLSSSCTLALTVDQVPPKCRNERSRRWGSRRPDQARRGPLIHRPPQRVWAPTRRCSMPCSAQRRARYRPPPTIQHMT